MDAYAFTQNLLIGILTLSFYQRIIKNKLANLIHLSIIVLVFSAYMFFCRFYIAEPFRLIIGLLIVGFGIWLPQKEVNGAALILALSSAFIVWLISVFITATIGIYKDMNNNNIELTWCIATVVQIILGFVFHKFFRLKNGIQNIHDIEIQGIIYSISSITFSVYCIIRLKDINFAREYRGAIAIMSAVIVVFLVIGLVFLIIYFSRKHREKLATTKQFHALEKELDELATRYHKYKEVVPAVSKSYTALLDELRNVTYENKTEHLESIKKRLHAVNQMACEIAEEFAVDEIQDNIRQLMLPEDWFALEQRIEQIIKECEHNDIEVFAQNSAKAWESLPISKTKFTRLVGNLLTNSVKELNKTDTPGKQIIIKFSDSDGLFELDVRDNAHEFPIEVLSKLGEHKNSTNGTGDGYAEIFEFINTNKTSLIINENAYKNEHSHKSVKVVFDNKAKVIMSTNYRYEKLKKALEDTKIEVKNTHVQSF